MVSRVSEAIPEEGITLDDWTPQDWKSSPDAHACSANDGRFEGATYSHATNR
jgi:hypothetical protein